MASTTYISAPGAQFGRSRRINKLRLGETLAAYGFIAPALGLILIFTLVPIVSSFALLFMKYDILTPPEFIGLENITRLFTDQRLGESYLRTLTFVFWTTLINNVLGFLLALGVNRAMPRVVKYLLRTAIFFPVLTTSASMAVVWQFLLAQDRGVLNYLLSTVGLPPVPWLSNSDWAMRSIILYDVWRACGYLMVLYLAGLQGIPDIYYEAAKVDGANRWQLLRHITLPLVSPTAFFCIVISVIGSAQVFDNAIVLTNGGPGDATRLIALYIYEKGFRGFEMGYAATVSVTLLFILLALTLVQFRLSRQWVHYD